MFFPLHFRPCGETAVKGEDVALRNNLEMGEIYTWKQTSLAKLSIIFEHMI